MRSKQWILKAGKFVGQKSSLSRNKKREGKASPRKPRANVYANWATQVRDRADRICQCCGGEGAESHHLFEKGSARFRHLRFDLRNGVYLCLSCHQTGPNAAHRNLADFRELMAARLDYFKPLYAEVQAKGYR